MYGLSVSSHLLDDGGVLVAVSLATFAEAVEVLETRDEPVPVGVNKGSRYYCGRLQQVSQLYQVAASRRNILGVLMSGPNMV